MKKCLICITLIIIFMFNILCENVVRATDSKKSSIDSIIDSGSSSVGESGNKQSVLPNDSLMGSVASIFIRLINPIPAIIRYFLQLIVGDNQAFSIERVIFNKIELFNIDFFHINTDSNNPNSLITVSNTNSLIKENVAKWFYTIRNLATVLNLLILLYIGIRMALSTIAEEKAKYKKMLLGWAEGFVIIFILPYIMILIIQVSDVLLGLFSLVHDVGTTENDIIKTMLGDKRQGFKIFIPSITYWVLVYYQIKFFLMYLKRFLSTGFLVIISPLITVTYALDKIGDQKPQIFTNWIKEFSVNVLIQALHAFMYLVLIASASVIISDAPIMFIIFLFGLSRSEKVLRNVFQIGKLSSIKSMQDTFKASDLKDKAKLIP